MKKFLALFLALTMLLGCIPALAAEVVIPKSMDETNAPARPVLSGYSLTEENGGYVLTADGLDNSTWTNIVVNGLTEDWDDFGEVELTWNEDKQAYTSDSVLSAEYSNSREIYIMVDNPNNSGYKTYSYSLTTGDQTGASLGIWTDEGNSWYSWNDIHNQFNYTYETGLNGLVDIYYNSTSGEIESYSVRDEQGITVNYTKYGTINSVYYWDQETGMDADWDAASQQWKTYDGEVINLPAFNEDDYKAPYAAEYVIDVPAATLDQVDTTKGEIVELTKYTVHYTDTMRAYYDKEGNLVKYTYWNFDQSRLVSYSANGTLIGATISSKDGNQYGYDVESGWFIIHEDGTISPATDLPDDVNVDDMLPLIVESVEEPEEPEIEYTWYGNNTMGVAGLSLRDMGKTDKWYNVVPVDLTQDAQYTYPLVASNLFHIGQAVVTVADGQVTVDYQLNSGHGYIKSECLKWFASIDDITTDFLNAPESDLAFGQPVSIADELGGADVGVLFICNRITYRQPYNGDFGYLSRYWPNRDRWVEYRQQLNELLGKEVSAE